MSSGTQEINAEERRAASTTVSESGLDENVAGALSYLLGIVTGLIFYLIEKDNPFVRFHAAQSMAVWGLVVVTYIVLSVIGTAIQIVTFSGSTGGFIVGSLISLVLGLVWLVLLLGGFALWIYLMVRAYQGETPRIPIAAGIADKLV